MKNWSILFSFLKLIRWFWLEHSKKVIYHFWTINQLFIWFLRIFLLIDLIMKKIDQFLLFKKMIDTILCFQKFNCLNFYLRKIDRLIFFSRKSTNSFLNRLGTKWTDFVFLKIWSIFYLKKFCSIDHFIFRNWPVQFSHLSTILKKCWSIDCFPLENWPWHSFSPSLIILFPKLHLSFFLIIDRLIV